MGEVLLPTSFLHFPGDKINQLQRAPSVSYPAGDKMTPQKYYTK
jgi:hypothetical protein